MKKLVYKISLIIISSVLIYCHSNSKSTSKDGKTSAGTKSSEQKSTSSNDANLGSAMKDTTRKPIGGTAIIHGEANQAQHDSIKDSKTKEKKK